MKDLFESLKEYFENTPQEILDEQRKELEALNEICPDVMEYAEAFGRYFGFTISCNVSGSLDGTEFKYNVSQDNKSIDSCSKYYLAS